MAHLHWHKRVLQIDSFVAILGAVSALHLPESFQSALGRTMDGGSETPLFEPCGVAVGDTLGPLACDAIHRLSRRLDAVTRVLGRRVEAIRRDAAQGREQLLLHRKVLEALAPAHDTRSLAAAIGLGGFDNDERLIDEILVSLLACPAAIAFPSGEEFDAHLRMRANIVRAARRTSLTFDGNAAERPSEYWMANGEDEFVLRAGVQLADALRMATQPDASGRAFTFGCYRATEYVIMLGIAEELAAWNSPLLDALEARWRCQSIQSAAFHQRFLLEYGSPDLPLPVRYYVPGDRVWFRNPHEPSSDISGYEGSWVIYLGGGQFSNFWKPASPYTLETKAVEIFHWRDGITSRPDGSQVMDEAIVDAHASATLADPARRLRVLDTMLRLADRRGVYADGGCIDRTREYPRHVCPGSLHPILVD
jgi:hypothetical protein